MQFDQPEHDSSFSGLDEIVARINAEPVPADLKDQVRMQLHDQLKPSSSQSHANLYAQVGAAILVVAACVAVVLLLRPSTEDHRATRESGDAVVITPKVEMLSLQGSVAAGPSLWTYHRAANTSLDDLDGLLAEHAAVVLTKGNSSVAQTGPSITSQLLEEI